jgi:enterochelin esterase-like enzyme
VRIAGEWYYSEALYSSQYNAAKIHPNDWYNGAIIHTDDVFPIRPFNDMELNKNTGYWAYTIPLASGTYCYQFLVGGKPEDSVDDMRTGKLMSDPQNMPAERAPNIETYSQVLVPYDPVKQSKSPDYTFYQFPRKDGKRGALRFETVPSKSLGFENGIGIYLPYGYDAKRPEPYPILYLSHGSAGFESNWMSQGMVPNISDNLIAEGLMEPMIVVTPNMRHANGDWFNLENVDRMGLPLPPEESKQGVTGTFVTYLMDELIPYMEQNYNVSKDPGRRAFSGLSRGGRLTFAMFTSNPTEFGYFYMMSSANDTFISQKYDLTRPELKEPTLSFGGGIFDRAFFSSIHPTQRALSENGIQFTTKYTQGGHRWHVWRELYVDLCTRVLWK